MGVSIFDTPFDVHEGRQRYAMEEEGEPTTTTFGDDDVGDDEPTAKEVSRTPRWIRA